MSYIYIYLYLLGFGVRVRGFRDLGFPFGFGILSWISDYKHLVFEGPCLDDECNM